MRRIAWSLLVLFVFAIPWEYALIFIAPYGNIARILGLALLLAAVPAVLQVGQLRTPGPLQVLVLVVFLWLCCSCFWTIDSEATLVNLRAYFQKMMIVWLVWEFAESADDLQMLLRAYVAGAVVLAVLTVANLATVGVVSGGQIRFAAEGQDPNDVADLLVLALPMAALLFNCEARRLGRWLALTYLPLGGMSILLTGSRGGLLAELVALVGCAVLLLRNHPRAVIAATPALPVVAAAFWFSVLHETAARLATIPEELRSGDLNLRWNIWSAGWDAFGRAPVLGSGAGTFALAAEMNFQDTAHNTLLSLLVSGGLSTLFLAVAIVALTLLSVSRLRGSLSQAMGAALLAWGVTAMVATVEESRATWLLIALVSLAGRLAVEDRDRLAVCFSARPCA